MRIVVLIKKYLLQIGHRRTRCCSGGRRDEGHDHPAGGEGGLVTVNKFTAGNNAILTRVQYSSRL